MEKITVCKHAENLVRKAVERISPCYWEPNFDGDTGKMVYTRYPMCSTPAELVRWGCGVAAGIIQYGVLEKLTANIRRIFPKVKGNIKVIYRDDEYCTATCYGVTDDHAFCKTCRHSRVFTYNSVTQAELIFPDLEPTALGPNVFAAWRMRPAVDFVRSLPWKAGLLIRKLTRPFRKEIPF
jgi:hypothetical protein